MKQKKPYNQKAIQKIIRARGIKPCAKDDPIYNEPLTVTFTNRRCNNSNSRLEALSKEFRRRLEERKKSGKSSKDIPSLTLAELRKLGLDTGTTVIVSGRPPKKIDQHSEESES